MSTQDWSYHRRLVKYEFVQSKDEGRDPEALAKIERKFEEQTGADHAKLEAIWDEIQQLPIRADFGFTEPNGLEEIRALRRAGPTLKPVVLSTDALYDRMLGAWLGRCAGCALGKPVEVCTAIRVDDPLTGQQRIKAYLQSIDASEYPLHDYFLSRPVRPKDPIELICPESTRQKIAYMQQDDDIRYTIIGQMVLREYGGGFTSDNVGRTWLRTLPLQWVCSAEATMCRNLAWRYAVHCGEWPRTKIDWEWVATYQNPYREWIGAQIRADSWGYAVPGNPELAAEFGWRDSRMSHVKNGIYGEMFIAAMIAAGFATEDPRVVVEAGLAQIPSTSRLYADIRETIEICDRHGNDPARFEAAMTEVNAAFRHYGTVHTNSNAAICAAALLLGKDDYEKTITIAVMAGLDTDCNGATVGSIWGGMFGAKRIPAKWTTPLHDTMKSQLIGYDPIAISECARRSVEIVDAVKNKKILTPAEDALRDDLIIE